ncbi:DUF3256 family protein [Bacteroides sp. 51]|uniref:DUF3256 family protein n=1 Tax=Bacteroides sp. 51 TaxID=2302938 RepID=UPI0013D8C7D2|nr:DUF3256 family protein [Bacteroides sp. 51]NDV81724.1 DUF3256 family protein [Bacteroides sp. 51]
MKNMKKILLVIFLFLAPFALQAQEAKTLFSNIPEAVLPLLSSVNRADFVDFLESNMKAEVKNKFGGTSEMTDLTSDYIRIQMTSRSTWEMKTLAVNDSTKIICTVSTTCAPVCDSEVRFYAADWNEIPSSSYLTPPVMDDYFQLLDSARLDDYTIYRSRMDMLLAKASLSKEDNTLTFTLTTPEYAGKRSADDENEIANIDEFLRKPLVFVWESEPDSGSYQFTASPQPSPLERAGVRLSLLSVRRL